MWDIYTYPCYNIYNVEKYFYLYNIFQGTKTGIEKNNVLAQCFNRLIEILIITPFSIFKTKTYLC